MLALLFAYFIMYCYYIATALRDLHTKPKEQVKVGHLIIRVQASCCDVLSLSLSAAYTFPLLSQLINSSVLQSIWHTRRYLSRQYHCESAAAAFW